MTTIAFDGKIMAADRCITGSFQKQDGVCKLSIYKNTVFGFSGGFDMMTKLLSSSFVDDFIVTKEIKDSLKNEVDEEDDSFAVLFKQRDNYDKNIMVTNSAAHATMCRQGTYAIGSGNHFAMGAM
ncbi:unnamed protein product, partial [marine sediment metagenome]